MCMWLLGLCTQADPSIGVYSITFILRKTFLKAPSVFLLIFYFIIFILFYIYHASVVQSADWFWCVEGDRSIVVQQGVNHLCC